MNYSKVAAEVAKLLEEKNMMYGDAITKTAEVLAVYFPDGIPTHRFKDALIMVRMLDKVCREATTPNEENWKDLCGYSLRKLAEYDNAKHAVAPKVEGSITRSETKYFDDLGNELHSMHCECRK